MTNNGDVPPSKFEANLVDEVRVSQADYDAETKVLTISAASSDVLMNPALAVDGFGVLVGGTLSIQGVAVPPPFVRVVSAAGGRSRMQVSTTRLGVVASASAQNDVAGTSENQSVVIDVRQNDVDAAALTVKLLGARRPRQRDSRRCRAGDLCARPKLLRDGHVHLMSWVDRAAPVIPTSRRSASMSRWSPSSRRP